MTLEGVPNQDVLEQVSALQMKIFGDAYGLLAKMKAKPNVVTIIAMQETKLVGYKIGYDIGEHQFYSWLGGVDEECRKCGVGARLMEEQHKYLKAKGYVSVQTKTMNKWRNMLILNIKYGFDVIETYTDEKGMHKIILEKNLIKED